MNETGLTIRRSVQFRRGHKGRKRLVEWKAEPAKVLKGRIPHVSRLMALAIRFEELVRLGEVRDYAELAKLGYVTRARVSQIMNLLNLAPDIQEDLLFLPETTRGRDRIKEWQLRPIASELAWVKQRRAWQQTASNYGE